MMHNSERDPYVEDGLAGSSSEHEARVPPCRWAPRLALAAGLLALWGSLAAVALRGGAAAAPGFAAVQAPADAPLVSFAADGGLAAEEANPPTEAVGRWGWDPAGEEGCVSVVKGARYWVEDRRPTGWTYLYSFDYQSEGWVPDSALYHGKPTIVRKAYSSNGFSVMPGDSVWVLDRKPSTTPGGPEWVYVLFMDKEAWIDESAIHENDIIHPTPCFVKQAFDAQDAAHLTISKGEVIWASVSPDPTAQWVLVENDRKETGWVPRKHLIENRPLPVLQTFNGDSKVQADLPSPLLYVTEGDTVWVEHSQTTPGWVYCYQEDQEGFLPEWALMQVLVHGKSEEVTQAETTEGQVPGEIAPPTVGTEAEGTPVEGAVTEATDATPAPTPAPTTAASTTPAPTTAAPTTPEPTTAEPTTAAPTTAAPTTPEPTTAAPTTPEPTTAAPTTPEPTTAAPTTPEPTTAAPTTAEPVLPEGEPVLPEGEPEETTAEPTTAAPTTAEATTAEPTSAETTAEPTETTATAE